MIDNFWKRKYLISDNSLKTVDDISKYHEVNTSTRNEIISLEAFVRNSKVHPMFCKRDYKEEIEHLNRMMSLYKEENNATMLRIYHEVYITPIKKRVIHNSTKDFYSYIGWDNKRKKWN